MSRKNSWAALREEQQAAAAAPKVDTCVAPDVSDGMWYGKKLLRDVTLDRYITCPADQRARRWAEYQQSISHEYVDLTRAGFPYPVKPEPEGLWQGPDCEGGPGPGVFVAAR